MNYLSIENPTLNYAPINLLSTKMLTPNLKVLKNKSGQKKHISNFNTNPKKNKNYNNTNRKKKHSN